MKQTYFNSALYVINGIICDFVDYFGKYPTVDEVRSNFNFPKICIDDNTITTMIDKVKKIDNN